jgi:hypothetical protein
MTRANDAEVKWEADKKRWVVRIRIGEEVIRRPCKGASASTDTEALRSLAIQTAREEGYDLADDAVAVSR